MNLLRFDTASCMVVLCAVFFQGIFTSHAHAETNYTTQAQEQKFDVNVRQESIDKKIGFDHSIYDQVLKSHVIKVRGGNATLVDYQRLKHSKPAIEKYLATVSKVDEFYFNSWSPDEQLAFLINTYNAKTLDIVLEKYPALDSIKDLGSIFKSVWAKDVIEILGQDRSLDDIEHTLIRGEHNFKRYGNDPRIHFAVNCASISCPGLYERAYTGGQLQEQLDLMTKRFLSDRANNTYSNGTLRVSKIFDWYSKDFTSGWRETNSLSDFFSLYSDSLGLSEIQVRALKKGQVPIHFINYNWNLNDGRTQ